MSFEVNVTFLPMKWILSFRRQRPMALDAAASFVELIKDLLRKEDPQANFKF